MRIGMVCPYSFDEPGGVQSHILDLARVLRSQGHHVEVIGPASAHTPLPDFVYRGGSAVPIRYNGSVARLAFGPRVRRNVRSFIEQGQFDVLHIHEPNSPSYSMYALVQARGPIVATYHAYASRSLLLTAFKPLLRPQLEKIRAGIAVSEMARRWQVQQLGGDPILIPNGVDTSLFEQERVIRNHEKTEIVFLGRLDEPRKGLDVLLRAIAKLSRAHKDAISVTVIGSGEPRNYPGVGFVGKVSDEDKARILGRTDIYVASNTGGESFGIVLVEAMAAGCAVVASDLEAFAHICEAESDDPAGLLFRTGSDEDLSVKLSWLLDTPFAREHLARRGSERAAAYDWTRVAERVLAVYETVADGSVVATGNKGTR